jgi:antitoxin (DNA-binding transcriptional repressor) of toxin-antitoxin stability system
MTYMSINEFNANTSAAFARAEKGERIIITRRGKEILTLSTDGIAAAVAEEQRRKDALERLRALMSQGLAFGGPATYDERTGSDRDEKWD